MNLEDIVIHGIAYDSRKVKPGDVFVAIPGSKADGYDYIPQAIKNGATTIVMSNDKLKMSNDGINYILVEDPRQALAELSARFYGHPSKKLKMIGVTGTNGKTTISYLIESILSEAGYKVGLIGTIETKIAGRSILNRDVQSQVHQSSMQMTTPESLELQELLYQMQKEGVTHVVMEVSSHSLAQQRVFGCEFDVAIYTNLTHDHLDFHKTMEQYLEEKKKLFKMLKPNSVAIINVDDKYSKEIAGVVETEVIFYGIHDAKHELRTAKHSSFDGTLEEYHSDIDWMRVKIDTSEIRTKLIGEYNVYNILAAYQCGLFFNVDRHKIKKGIEKAFVPGRLERIENNRGIKIFVDFAHSPDALQKLLETLRPFVQGKLILVFGCPGDRDKDKRPVMGRIASELADVVVVTTDDPHSEDPEQIIDGIVVGMPSPPAPLPEGEGGIQNISASKNWVRVLDRRSAIEKSVSLGVSGDILVIAGRGHEKYQDFNGTKIFIDDREIVRAILAHAPLPLGEGGNQ